MVLRSVGVVDAVVDRSVYRLERDLLRHAGGDDPPGLLPRRSLVPTRILSVVARLQPVDAGPLRIARYLEPFSLAMAQLAYEGDEGPEIAYRIERFGK